MADVEVAFTLDAPAWQRGALPESEEEEQGSPEGHDPSQAGQRGELDQRIARVLGNLDKVVKDPTRGGAMAGDYGTFMPVVFRANAGALLPEQMFVQDKGGIDIPSLRPRSEPAPPQETPLPAPPVQRPKTATKKPTGPASTVLVNIDSSLFATEEPSRAKKPLKGKARLAALSSKLGDLPSSPHYTPSTRHLPSTPPGSPGFKVQTPSSNASTPERSPASIIKIMTMSALPSGSYLSPLGDMAPWPRPAGQRVSSLGALHERLADAGGAVDISSDKEGRGGTERDAQSPPKVETRKKESGGKKDKSKKRVEEKEGPSVLEGAKVPADVPRNTAEKSGGHEEGLLGLLGGEIEDFSVKETSGSQKQHKVRRRQLVQQLSVDQERLQAILGGGDESEPLRLNPHATLKEVERLRKEIERKEEMLKRKLEEQEDSGSSSEEETGGGRQQQRPVGLETTGAGKESADLPSQGHRTAKGMSGGQMKVDAEEGSKQGHQARQETKQTSEQSAREVAAKKEERRRKRREIQQELRRLEGGVTETDGAPAAKDQAKERKSSEREADPELDRGKKEGSQRGNGVREGKDVKQAVRLGKEHKKLKKKKHTSLAPASNEAPINAKLDSVKKKEESVHEKLPLRGNSVGGANKVKKKKQQERSDAVAGAGGNQVKTTHEQRASSELLQSPELLQEEKVTKAKKADAGTAPKSKQLQAAAREALPEAQQERLRQATETGKLVAAGGFVLLGPRTAAGDDEYVGCDRCEKWRMLPYWLHRHNFEDVDWTCDQTDWLGKEFVGCHVDEAVFEEQTKYVNYPPVGGWEKIKAELDKQGSVEAGAPPIASPGKKPKHSGFKQRLQQEGEKPGKLHRGQSANGRKEKQGVGEDRNAKSPLGRRKRLLKEGERQKRRVQLGSNESTESSEGEDKDWADAGRDKQRQAKKESKKGSGKKRKVVRDEEESAGEETGPVAQAVAGTKQASAEEEDWVVDEEPSTDEAQAGGASEQQAAGGSVDQVGRRSQSPSPRGETIPRRMSNGEEGPAGNTGRKEQKRKLDDIVGEERQKEKRAKVEQEVPKVSEQWAEVSAGNGVGNQREEGKDEPAFPETKETKVKQVSEVDEVGLPELPGLKSSTKVPRRTEERVEEGEEVAERGSKRPRVAGGEAAKQKEDAGVDVAQAADAVGPSTSAEHEGEESSVPAGKGKTRSKEAADDKGTHGVGPNLRADPSDVFRGVKQSGLTGEWLGERDTALEAKRSAVVEGEGSKEADRSMVRKEAQAQAEEETRMEKNLPSEEQAARDRRGAPGAAEPACLEEETSAALESKEDVIVATPMSASNEGVPRQLQVGNGKVASTESAPRKVGGQEDVTAATPAAQASCDDAKSTAAAKKETVAPKSPNKESVRGNASCKESDAPATGKEAMQHKLTPPKKHTDEKDGKRPRRRLADSSEDSSSSSEVSSSDLSSDGSELAQEEVVQPVKRTPPSKDGGSRETAGNDKRKGSERAGTSRSTVVQVASPKRRGHSPLQQRGLSRERDSPPPSKGERRDWDRREWERGSYRSSPAGCDRHRTPVGRDRARDRERSRFYDARDRGRREYERGYDREWRYRREELSPWRERRGGEQERRSSRPERSGSKGRSRSRSESLDKEGRGAKRAGPPSKGGSRQATPLQELTPSKEGGPPKSTPRPESMLQGDTAKAPPDSASGKSAQLAAEGKVSSPPDMGALASSAPPAPKAPSEGSRMAGSMAPPPPPAAASGPAAVGGHEEARKQPQKLMKEAKDTKHAADNLKAQGQTGIAGMVYLEAALKFLLAASSLETADPKQAATIFRETAEWLEGLCLAFYRPNQALAAEALAWKCTAIARTRSLHAIRDRVLKDRAALHDCLLPVAPCGGPGAVPRPPSAGPQVPGNQGVGTPPLAIIIVESPSSSSASEADAAQVAVSLAAHHREPFSSMLNVVQEHFQITACWTRAANVATQAVKTLKPEAQSALSAVGEYGGMGCLESIVQAARIALDKFGD